MFTNNSAHSTLIHTSELILCSAILVATGLGSNGGGEINCKRDHECVSVLTFEYVAINFIRKSPLNPNNSAYKTVFCLDSATQKERISLCKGIL